MSTTETHVMLTYFQTNENASRLVNRLLIEEFTPAMLSDWMTTYIGTQLRNGNNGWSEAFQFGHVDYLQVAETLAKPFEKVKKEGE